MKEIKVPELAESITEGTITEWLVKVGDTVAKGDPVVELETDKVNLEVNSDYSGVIVEIVSEEGEDVAVGDVIAKVDESGEAPVTTESTELETKEPAKESVQEESKVATEVTEETPEVVATPAASKRARELDVDLTEVLPRDPLGRIRPEDVEVAKAQQAKAKPEQASAPVQEVPATPAKPEERVRMSRRRMTIAKRLVEAQHNAAMLTTFNEVDMTAVMNLRSERRDKFEEKHGVRLGFMSFFTKAVVGALKDFPLLNAEIQDNELVIKKFYDIGMAVSTEEGLVVPVVRDADKLDFAGIEKEIIDLATKARDNKLTLDDLQGGTFTITNGGIFGSLLSTPILNAPQVGILGMHTIQKRPVVMPDDSIDRKSTRLNSSHVAIS